MFNPPIGLYAVYFTLYVCLASREDFIVIFHTEHSKQAVDSNSFWHFSDRVRHNGLPYGGQRNIENIINILTQSHDVHSPVKHGFWYSHVGWILCTRGLSADYSLIKDFQKYPELVWLGKYHTLPAVLLAVFVWAIAGWSGLVVGFVISTVLLYHGTFTINSLSHIYGKQRYDTGDNSRNNLLLAIITLGEGWHNNHHHFPSAAPQGFRWWQIDITYYILRLLSVFRIVWDLRLPPAHVVAGKRRTSLTTIENAAQQLAASFSIEQISKTVLQVWEHTPKLEELQRRARNGQAEVEAFLKEMKILELPKIGNLTDKAQNMFTHIPSLNPIVERANQIIVQAVSVWLLQNDMCETAVGV